MKSVKMLSDYELLYTTEGRDHLRKWCSLTRLTGEAQRWLARLAEAEKKVPVPEKWLAQMRGERS